MKPYRSQHTEEGKVMFPAGKVYRKKQRHQKRSGEDKDKRFSEGKEETAEHYEASRKSFAVIKDLVKELHYWKEEAVSCLKFMKSKTSKINYRKQMVDEMRNRRERIQDIPGHCCCCSLPCCCYVFYVRENNDLRKSLKKATAEQERLQDELSEKDMYISQLFRNE